MEQILNIFEICLFFIIIKENLCVKVATFMMKMTLIMMMKLSTNMAMTL